jgi:hypothetical protein
LRRPESRDKLSALVQHRDWGEHAKRRLQEELEQMATSAHRLPVTLAIIGVWQNPTIKNLSLLSRMALRTGMQRLSDLGYRTELILIGHAGKATIQPNWRAASLREPRDAPTLESKS